QALKVRSRSRDCLWQIQLNGDESVQAEIVNAGFIGVMIIAISTAGGSEEDETDETHQWLKNISRFLYYLRQGGEPDVFNRGTTFPPQPILRRICEQQMEEEGADEEIESQLINNQLNRNEYEKIRDYARGTKLVIMNRYIDLSNESNAIDRW
ncbi:MAG: hypothetical protein EZS28_052637, partial [Streblomastix strix]